MINICRRELQRLELLKPPVVHLHSSLGEAAGKLKEAVVKMGGQVVEDEGGWCVVCVGGGRAWHW